MNVAAIAIVLALTSTAANAQWTPKVQPVSMPDAPQIRHTSPVAVPVSLPKPIATNTKAAVITLVSMPKPYTKAVTPVAVVADK